MHRPVAIVFIHGLSVFLAMTVFYAPISSVSGLLLILAGLTGFFLSKTGTLRRFLRFQKRPSAEECVIALKAAVIYVVLANMQIFTLDYFLGQSEAQPISAPKIDWLFFLFAISFGPFFEELLARGYLLEAFLRRRQLIPGALFVSVIFALAHYPMVLAAISVRLAVDLFTYLAQEHQKF